MGRKSTISQLPTPIKAECDRLIREGSATIDQIVEHLRELGAEIPRSTLGNYKKKTERSMARYCEAQQVAGVWVAELGHEPESKMGQLLAELLKSIAFRTLASMQNAEDGAEPGELMLLAKTLKDLATAQKTDLDFRQRVRAEYQAEMEARVKTAAAEVDQVTARAGLTNDAAARIRELVLGVVG